MQRKVLAVLADIQDAAQFVLDDTAIETIETYRSNRRLRNSVERNFENIGEAMRRLSDLDPDLAARITGRREIIALRNVLAHGYDIVDDERVWQIAEEASPTLLAEVRALLQEVDGG